MSPLRFRTRTQGKARRALRGGSSGAAQEACRVPDREEFTYKLVFVLTLVWAVIAVAGGVYNLATGPWLQGLGLVASGALSFVAFYLIRIREHYFIASIIVLVSGAATLQIVLLVFSFFISFLVYSNAKLFSSK